MVILQTNAITKTKKNTSYKLKQNLQVSVNLCSILHAAIQLWLQNEWLRHNLQVMPK